MIDGAAVFVENGIVANLSYRVECSADWTSERAVVTGWLGERSVDVTLHRNGGCWDVCGVPVQGDITGLCDVDLGFTPATNTNAMRRLGLNVGEEADVTALWLDVDNWAVKPLRQIYRRLARDRFEYTSPDHDYRTVLTLNAAGLVTDYPDLWSAQTAGG